MADPPFLGQPLVYPPSVPATTAVYSVVNPNTVIRTYRELEIAGVFERPFFPKVQYASQGES